MQDVQSEPIAIIGIGCRFPQAQNPQEFWTLLREGKEAIREVPADRWDVEKLYDPDVTAPGKMMSRWGGFLDQVDRFDWRAFRMLPHEVTAMDPQHRLLLEVAWEALEDAGLPLAQVAGSRTSVSIGIGWSDYQRLQARNWSQLDGYSAMGNANSFAANRLSYLFDLKGPSVSVDTGCTSSLSAVSLACQNLWTGAADLALAGGVNLMLSPDSTIMVSKAGLLSQDGHCKTLDVRADGFVRGEGAGVLILKRLSDVQASDRVYALIRNIALNHNGHNEWISAASQPAQETLLREIYQQAGVSPSEVDYVELHGTGFRRGDAIETSALGAVLGTAREQTRPCFVGSVKTNIGHLEAAAGIASLIKVALSLSQREIPPTLNLKALSPDIVLDDLHLAAPQTCIPWPEKETLPIAGITTLAFTGANAHAILSAHNEVSTEYGGREKPLFRLLPLSARSEQALYEQAQAYLDFLLAHASDTAPCWRDICYTASVRRTHHPHRLVVVGRTRLEAAEALRRRLQEQNSTKSTAIDRQQQPYEHSASLEALKALYLAGHEIDWSELYQGESCHCVSLPQYRWQRERLWPIWLDVQEISTPPEEQAVDQRKIKRPDTTEISGRSIEQVLTELWAETLGLEKVNVSDSFFALGGHSLIAQQLLARIRLLFQKDIALKDLLEAPTPLACAELISQRPPFQANGNGGEASSLPRIEPDPGRRYEPFPTTDIQQAYWVGRHAASEGGNVGNHGYIEVEATDLDLKRFEQALQRLIERHDMLRAVLLPDGQQQVLAQVPPFEIKIVDLRGQDTQEQAHRLEQIRQTLDHQLLSVEQWPAFELWVSYLDDRHARLHLSIESLFVDAWSMNMLLHEFIRLYHEPDLFLPMPALSFRDYVHASISLQDSALAQRSRAYWTQRLSSLPPAPDLPLVSEMRGEEQPHFVHREARLSQEHWQQIKAHAAKIGVTPSGVLLAAFAEIIARWSKTARFSINLSTFNRLPFQAQVNEIVGDFTSLLVLAVDYTLPASFESHARRVQEQLWNDLDHSYYSGIQILRDLTRAQGEGMKAIMPIVFTSLLVQDTAPPFSAPWGKTLYCVSQTPQVWLDHQVLETGGELVFHWQSVDALFPAGLIDAMFGTYCQLLQRLVTEEESWSQPVRSLLPEEHRALIEVANATEAPVSHKLLHTFFLEQVAQRPEQLALVSATRRLTYQEVRSGALQLAHQLRVWGVRSNQLVGVVMENGWEQVVAVLGVLFSGAAYLPIDANLPRKRLHYLLENGAVEVVLTQSWIERRIAWSETLKRFCVDSLDMEKENISELESVQHPDDLAYVIYTSGSTGQPKGVMIDHRGAVNTILDINKRFSVNSGDRVFALSALNFDLSVYDIFGTLAAGGTIIMPGEKTLRDPGSWLRIIEQEQVTIWNTVPALLQLLVEYAEVHSRSLNYSHLRLALLSGDWIPLALPGRLQNLCPGIEVVSLGGATEASIWSILYPITTIDPSWKSIPYGQPMRNQQFFVLDKKLEPCPVWVAGDLYIAGIGLARGYWRDEEKTQDRFFIHPHTGIRLYRTGDLGRYQHDGTIEFLGREDFQIKVQGHRIELGEIEATLAQYAHVQEAIVIALGASQSNKRLAAYVVPRPGHTLTADELQYFLTERLPEYMVPTSFYQLSALPLMDNGKVDRRALPAFAPLPLPRSEHLETPLETMHEAQASRVENISQLVTDVLKIEWIDPARNLLEYGATSMDIFRIASLLESQLHVHLEFGQLFRLSTINAIAAYCEEHFPSEKTAVSIVEPAKKRETGYPSVASNSVAEVPVAVFESGKNHSSASFDLLLDPEERDRFKRSQPSLRSRSSVSSEVELLLPALEGDMLRTYTQRRSSRTFAQRAIHFKQFSEFLGCLRQISLDGKPKYQWGSAGGLYPVQLYTYVKSGGIEGIEAGIYYYHPVHHRLVLITPDVELERGVFGFINQSVFDQSAFALFLIGQLKAIEPMYAELSRDFCLIEAGLMTQLLEMSAPAYQIGLCQTGGIGFKKIERLLALEEGSLYLHSLLGGAREVVLPESPSPSIEEEEDWEEITL